MFDTNGLICLVLAGTLASETILAHEGVLPHVPEIPQAIYIGTPTVGAVSGMIPVGTRQAGEPSTGQASESEHSNPLWCQASTRCREHCTGQSDHLAF